MIHARNGTLGRVAGPDLDQPCENVCVQSRTARIPVSSGAGPGNQRRRQAELRLVNLGHAAPRALAIERTGELFGGIEDEELLSSYALLARSLHGRFRFRSG